MSICLFAGEIAAGEGARLKSGSLRGIGLICTGTFCRNRYRSWEDAQPHQSPPARFEGGSVAAPEGTDRTRACANPSS